MLHQRSASYPSLQLSQRWRFGASQWSASSSSPSSPTQPSWFRCLLLFSEEDFFIFPTSWWSVGRKGVGRWNLGCFWLFSFSRPFFLSFMLLLKYISKNGLRKPLVFWIMDSLAEYGRVDSHYIIFDQLSLSRWPHFEAYLSPLRAIVKYFLQGNLYVTGRKRKNKTFP